MMPSASLSPPAQAVCDLRRRVTVALSLLLFMLYPHSGALGLGSAPLFLACVYAFFRMGSTLRIQPASSSAFSQDALDERPLLRALVIVLAVLQVLRLPGDALHAETSRLPHSLLAVWLAGVGLWATRLERAASPRASRALAAVCVLSAGSVFAYLLLHAPSPRIDVFELQQRGAALLWSGQNPYSALYPNPYDPVETTTFFGHYSATLDHYPYPPLSLLTTALAHRLTHDVRWLFLLSHLLIGWALYRLSQPVPRAHPLSFDRGLVLLCIHLLHPRGFLVIEQAWTEPLVAGAISLWALFRAQSYQRLEHEAPRLSLRVRVIADSLLLGLAIACKQYGLLLLVPYLFPSLFAWISPAQFSAQRLSAFLLALLPLVVSYLAFAVVQPADFVEDVLLFQTKQPFRSDALSLPALFYAVSDVKLPGAVAAIGVLLPLLLVWRKRPPGLPAGLGGLLLLASLLLFGFFATAKQAFCNYYYLVGVLLLLTLARLDEAADAEATSHLANRSEDPKADGCPPEIASQPRGRTASKMGPAGL